MCLFYTPDECTLLYYGVCHVKQLILQVNLAIFYLKVNGLVKYYGQSFHVISEGHIGRLLSLQLAKPALQQGVCNLNIF